MKFTSYQGNSSLNKFCQSNFIPGAVFGTNVMDLKSSAAAELVDLDCPVVKTRLETGSFSLHSHPKAPWLLAPLVTRNLACLGAFLLSSFKSSYACEACSIRLPATDCAPRKGSLCNSRSVWQSPCSGSFSGWQLLTSTL